MRLKHAWPPVHLVQDRVMAVKLWMVVARATELKLLFRAMPSLLAVAGGQVWYEDGGLRELSSAEVGTAIVIHAGNMITAAA